jgi:hypothetical protein
MSRVAIGKRFKSCKAPLLVGLPLLTHFNRLIDADISTPCSIWEQYRGSRTSWGINVLGSFLVEIEATDGTVGFATGFGGEFVLGISTTSRSRLKSEPRSSCLLARTSTL